MEESIKIRTGNDEIEVKKTSDSILQEFNMETMQNLGNTLVSAAEDRRKKQMAACLTGQVEELLRMKTIYENMVREGTAGIAAVQKRLDAINKGEFAVNSDMQIVFTRKQLTGGDNV